MDFYFATCCAKKAKEYLAHEAYNFLNQKQKICVLENLNNDICLGVRVQDPAYHVKPQIMTSNAEVYNKLMG
jgi:hypothetical protein